MIDIKGYYLFYWVRQRCRFGGLIDCCLVFSTMEPIHVRYSLLHCRPQQFLPAHNWDNEFMNFRKTLNDKLSKERINLILRRTKENRTMMGTRKATAGFAIFTRML